MLITVDAVNAEDFAYFKTLPSMAELIGNGAYTDRLRTIYPSDTYPVHTTISTGRYPETHDIEHNKPFRPGMPEAERPWHWFRSEIKAPVFYEEAQRAGRDTALILWPVSCGAKVRMLLPEILAVKGENQVGKIVKYATKPFIFQAMWNVRKEITGVTQPHIDRIMAKIASYVIKKKKPGLLMLHLFAGDSEKHGKGTRAPSVKTALELYDSQIGEVMNAAKQVGIFEKTAFLIVSDHGQADVYRHSHLNNLFLREGLLKAEAGKLLSWKAYADSCGTSAAIHTDGPDALQKAREVLEKAKEAGEFGIERILDRAELDKQHYGSGASLSVEALSGIGFTAELSDDNTTELENGPKGDHGDLPDKEHHRCIFVASGAGVKKRGALSGVLSMTDVAPTAMKLLGLEFPCEGHAAEEIIFDHKK